GLPLFRQTFVARQDLLDDEIGGTCGCMRRALLLECAQSRPELSAIIPRLRQPIDVIDAHTVDQALGVEAQHGGVNRLKYLVVFDSKRGKLVDIEEAAPVYLVVCGSPPCQPIVLTLEQGMQHLAPTG